MALRLVRQTSETPNITNKDDTIMTRYAYGGYNGIVNGFGNECGYIAENGIFKVLDGRIVIGGWEIDIDGAGWSLNLSTVTGTQYHSIYAQINVSVETVDIKSSYYSGSYPTIEKGDDLTAIPNGTARLLLYNVKVDNGVIDEVIKKFETIPYLAQKVLNAETNIQNLEVNLKNGSVIPKIAEYASSDYTKGTIDERLTKLGFKEGSVTLSSGTATVNKVTRQGNYVIGYIVASDFLHNTKNSYTMQLPEYFRPLTKQSFVVGCNIRVTSAGGSSVMAGKADITITTDGVIKLDNFSLFGGQIEYLVGFNINFGYEALPIE